MCRQHISKKEEFYKLKVVLVWCKHRSALEKTKGYQDRLDNPEAQTTVGTRNRTKTNKAENTTQTTVGTRNRTKTNKTENTTQTTVGTWNITKTNKAETTTQTTVGTRNRTNKAENTTHTINNMSNTDPTTKT